jgi:hypothetical protein
MIVAALAGPAAAVIQSGDKFILDFPTNAQMAASGYPTPHGTEGPFYLNPLGGTSTDGFLTFCVEETEYFYTGGNTYTVGNGPGTGIGYQTVETNWTLSPYTAWLYTNFSNHTMPANWTKLITASDSLYNPTLAYNVLQYAVWAGMTKPGGGGSVGASDAEQQFGVTNGYLYAGWSASDLDGYGIGPTSFASSGWSGFHDVVVLNLYDSNNYKSQDQLAIIPGHGGPPGPEPISLVIWSLLGLCVGIATYWRRRK